MKIGILQADSVLEKFQPKHGNYPGMFEATLGKAADSLNIAVEFQNYDVEHGEYPESPDECDAYVITGSKKSVYDDEPWISELKAYVQELDKNRTKLVGVCFGHQLVADALGGKTVGAEVGWGVGIHRYNISNSQPFMNPAYDSFSLIVSHRDQVVELPDGAELIASSDFCPNSMYHVGNHIFAMQGHPEFDRSYSEDLMDMREEILGPDTYSKGKASLAEPLERDEVAKWIVRFITDSE